MAKLPPSADALAEEAERGEVVLPEQREFPWSYFGRGRGALLILAALGLIAFFLPWVEVRMPESRVLSGFDLARGRAGWLWGGAVGWLVTIPLVWTRRTVERMRGVRAVTVVFALMTLIEVAMLLLLPPQRRGQMPVDFVWRFGLFASGAVSLVATFFALRFGGDLEPLPKSVAPPHSQTPLKTKRGKTLH
jgi:hypothetical protein